MPQQQRTQKFTLAESSIGNPINPAGQTQSLKEKGIKCTGHTCPRAQVRFWHRGSLAHPHGEGQPELRGETWGRDFLLPSTESSRNEQQDQGWLPTCSQWVQGAASIPEILQSCTTSILGRRLRRAALHKVTQDASSCLNYSAALPHWEVGEKTTLSLLPEELASAWHRPAVKIMRSASSEPRRAQPPPAPVTGD